MAANYNRVTGEIIETLRGIVGHENVMTDEEATERHSCDEMPTRNPHTPDVVVRPEDATAVAKLLRLANEKRIPVTPPRRGPASAVAAYPYKGDSACPARRGGVSQKWRHRCLRPRQ